MELDLGKGRIALIDDEDWTAERCNYRKDGTVDRVRACDLSWYAHTVDGRTYVWSCYRANGLQTDKRYSMNLHRLITECPADKIVDHRSGDGLDNRRSNLRVCEPMQNSQNRAIRKRTFKSVYKGVSHEPKRGQKCWGVRIGIKGKRCYVSYHDTQLEAALVYDDCAHAAYGEYARLNFPERMGLNVNKLHAV